MESCPLEMEFVENQMEIATILPGKPKKSYHLPPEVWFDVFDFLSRMQLAEHASLACRKLCTLAQAWIEQAGCARVLPHLEIRKPGRMLKRDADLRICAKVPPPKFDFRSHHLDANMLISAIKWRNKHIDWLPIAEVAPPKNIVDFRTIRIFHFDDIVTNFLRLINHLFTTNLNLHIPCLVNSIIPPALDSIMAILQDCPALLTFSLVYSNSKNQWAATINHSSDPSGIVPLFARFPAILEHKMHLLALTTWESTETEEEIAILVQWLSNSVPLVNGKPRMLAMLRQKAHGLEPIVERIIEAFVGAEQPANFMVRFRRFNLESHFKEFSMENARTEERLVMRHHPNVGQQNWFLRRYSTKTNEQGHGAINEKKQDALERELLEIADRPGTGNMITERTRQAIYLCMTAPPSSGEPSQSGDLKRKKKEIDVHQDNNPPDEMPEQRYWAHSPIGPVLHN